METRLIVCVHVKDARHRGGCGDFAAATRVLLLVSHGGLRDRLRQVLHCMTRRQVRKSRDHWERRCTGREVARFAF